MRYHSILALLVCLTLVACSPISSKAKRKLRKPVDCEKADYHLEILRKERASTTRQIQNGVASVLPAAVVVNLLSGKYTDGIRVMTGSYNKDIDRKIHEIESACGEGS